MDNIKENKESKESKVNSDTRKRKSQTKTKEEDIKKPKTNEDNNLELIKLNDSIKLYKNIKLSNDFYDHYEFNIKSLQDLILLATFYKSKKYDKSKHTNLPFYTIYKLKEPITNLLNMVGLENLKSQILSLIVYYLQQFEEENQDMLHTVVYGSPGVGKTKFINILSEVYANLGVLSSRKVTFVKRADLVGQYLGQTAIKTKEVIEKAKGGILVIDEAYSLGDTEQKDSFSRECIDTLNQYLSEDKKDLICVIAGYKEDLEKRFFKSNPGLERRFPFKFTITDYTSVQLKQIFLSIVKENNWKVDKDAVDDELLEDNRHCFQFNGGDMELLFTHTKFIHSMRVFSAEKKAKKCISKEDFEKAIEKFKNSDTSKKKQEQNEIMASLFI
jgi:replication-associated recombination protein RarA